MTNGICVGGKIYPVINPVTGKEVPVRRWNDGLTPKVPEFKAGDGYNKKRLQPIDLFVFHWTGGEQDPIPMCETLRARKLGVEFAISRSGTIYQFCDPMEVDTADAGFVNSRSAGCEIINYGYSGQFTIDPVRAIKVPVVPKIAKDRPTYQATVHGRTVTTAEFYPCQTEAALGLANAFAQAVPACVRKVPPANCTTEIPKENLKFFKGFIGHYHITVDKRDPGTQLIDRLRAEFDVPQARVA